MSNECVFCKIVAGQIPSSAVLETEDALAFLDIGPLAPGHTLLIPKNHYERVSEMPGEEAGRVLSALPKLCQAVAQATGAEGFNVFQTNGECAGQVVPHVHFHIIPRNPNDGLGFRWKPGKYVGGEMEAMQEKIKSAL